MSDALAGKIATYIEEHWDEVLADIDALVRIESVEDLAQAHAGAPYGPGPRAALDEALAIAARMGFNTCDCEGHIGYADLPGAGEGQIGIIGHVDVVPAGPGWHSDPYAVERRDGYLIGRGVLDDKGPIVVALHAARFWLDELAVRGRRFPKTLRVLFGANEETNMKDVAYYRAHFDDPDFLFTPDAEFPVCYGEAGICSGTLSSAPIADGALAQLAGGVAVNAVPGEAQATVRLSNERACEFEQGACGDANVTCELAGETSLVVKALGKSAHASTPHLGVNAIDVLVAYLLESDLVSEDERRFLQLVRLVTANSDGSGLGVAVSDEHFGDLTSVGGTIRLEGDRILLTIDFRYPTTVTAKALESQVNALAGQYGAAFVMEHDKKPFLANPDAPEVRALVDAYNEVTGEGARPFTMKGGTYARAFSRAASFGADKPWVEKPAWVGGMHGPDEGVSEELLRQALAIYVRAIGNLMGEGA